MDFEISNLTDEKIDFDLMKKVINRTSERLKITDSIVGIVLIDNERIHEINKTYRGIDRPTDVISFAFMDDETNPNSRLTDLGEIYISLEKAHEQAKEYGHSFERELSFLLVHGLLHLLGYDHMEEKEEKIMFSLQDEILESLGIIR